MLFVGQKALDNLDRRILFELSADSRQPFHGLGRKIRVSPQRVEYRVKELVRRKVILDFITVVDYPKIGLNYYVLNLSLKNITGEKKEKILRALMEGGKNSLLLKGDGEWEVSVGFLSKDAIEAQERLWKIESMFEPHVEYENIFVHVGATHFPRLYFPTLQQTPWEEDEWSSGEGGHYALDDAERGLLGMLSENSRAGTVEMARKIGISEPTVRQKLKKLKKEGVIRGFTLNIDPNLAEHHFVRLYIRRNYSLVGNPDRMMCFFRSNPRVYRVIRTIGKYDIICDVRMQDDDELRNFTRELRDRFAGMMVSQDPFRVYDIYRYNFFPTNWKK